MDMRLCFSGGSVDRVYRMMKMDTVRRHEYRDIRIASLCIQCDFQCRRRKTIFGDILIHEAAELFLEIKVLVISFH